MIWSILTMFAFQKWSSFLGSVWWVKVIMTLWRTISHVCGPTWDDNVSHVNETILYLIYFIARINPFQIVYSFVSFRHDSYKANHSVNLEWFVLFCLTLGLGHVWVVKHAIWLLQRVFDNQHKRYRAVCIRASCLHVSSQWYWLLAVLHR